MANEQNLKPVRSTEEARERGRNGGIASGKARRKKAALKKCAMRVLQSDIPKELRPSIDKLIGGLEEENDTLYTAAVAGMVKESIAGNAKAFHELRAIVDDMDAVYIEDEQEEDDLSRSLRELAEEMNNA